MIGLPVRVMATSERQRRWCWKAVLAAFWEDRAAACNEAILAGGTGVCKKSSCSFNWRQILVGFKAFQVVLGSFN